jgi:hypothetical protein
MVGDQTANQAANPLKKETKKKKNHQFWNSRIAILVVPLASRPVCVCLLGRFGALLWEAFH